MIIGRRQFFNKIGRVFLLGTLTGGTLFLVSRNKVDLTCSEDGICRSCSLYADCNLDKAKESREDERKGK